MTAQVFTLDHPKLEKALNLGDGLDILVKKRIVSKLISIHTSFALNISSCSDPMASSLLIYKVGKMFECILLVSIDRLVSSGVLPYMVCEVPKGMESQPFWS